MKALPILVARLGALVIATLAVHRFGYSIPYMTNLTAQGYAIAVGGMLVFPLILALVLWLAPNALLGKDIDLSSEQDTAISATTLSRIGVALLAIWVLAFGIIDLIYFEAEIIASRRAFESSFALQPEQFAGRVTNIAQITIGLGLWLKRHVVAGLVMGGRNAA